MSVIDHHDDLGESFLSSIDLEKAAEILKVSSWRESAELLDRDFALIIVDDEGKEHRKFACFDPGNALMSEWYLLNAEHGLGGDAVKVAAANIAGALDHFGMVPTPATVYLADGEAGSDARRVKIANAMNPNAYAATANAPKMGGASMRPMSSMPTSISAIKAAPSTIAKVASAFDYVAEAKNRWDDLDPYDRHDVAVDLVKVAEASGATVPDYIYKYSGTTLNPMFKKIAQARKQFSANTDIQEGYDRLSKMAGAMDPEDVIEAMFLLDEQAGIFNKYGSRLPDPVLSVYGTTKEAEYSWTLGGDYVTASMLKRYAGSVASNQMEEIFSEDLKDLFRRDPITVFKKMPEEQQILVARLASQSRDTNNGGY